MTVSEFSDSFDTVVDSYRRFKDFDKREMLDSIEFNEYEKSVFLTLGQSEVVVGLYNGQTFGLPFENTEEMRRYLESLVKTKVYNALERESGTGLTTTSVFFQLPDDLAFITLERAQYTDPALGCYNGSEADVYPTTQDEYARIRKNPFRGPTRYRVLRLDCGDGKVELVSKYNISKYIIRYMAKPEPIVLEDLTGGLSVEGVSTEQTCQLNEMLHRPILYRAVQLALASKGIQVN